jgi:chitodextrinase
MKNLLKLFSHLLMAMLFTTLTVQGQTTCTTFPTPSSATNITSTSFTANWSSVSGARAYQVNLRLANGTYQTTTFQNAGTNTSFTYNNLTAGTAYQYQVRVQCSNGAWSNWSGSSSMVTTLAVQTCTTVPTPSSATNITSTSFTANWSSVSGARAYQVNLRFANGTYQTTTFQNAGTNTSFTYNNLTAGTAYQYQVRVQCSNGVWSNWSGSSSMVTTLAVQTCTTVPTPSSATNITSTSFTANWSNVSGARAYQVNLRLANGTYQTTTFQNAGTNTSFTYNNLTAGTAYQYQVRVQCSNGVWSNWSGSSSIVNTLITYEIIREGRGVKHLKRNQLNRHIIEVDISKGAKIDFITNTITDAGSNNGVYATNNPLFAKKKIQDYWGSYKANSNAFAILNGAFFQCKPGTNPLPTCEGNSSVSVYLSFPLKINNTIISGGNDGLHNGGDLDILLIKNDKVEIKSFKKYAKPVASTFETLSKDYHTAIVGYAKDALVKRNEKINRTWIGVKNSTTLLFFVAEDLTADEAERTLISLGCTNMIMLDGGGSSKLMGYEPNSTNNKEYLLGSCYAEPLDCWRTLPQVIGIRAGTTGSGNREKLSLSDVINVDETTLMLYPNPANGNEVYFTNPISFTLLNIQGQVIKTYEEPQNSLDISQLKNGLYIIQTNTGKAMKLVIEK